MDHCTSMPVLNLTQDRVMGGEADEETDDGQDPITEVTVPDEPPKQD